MNTVEPIRDIEVVLDIADYLKERNRRDYVMFMFGIYSGLRICDILQFRVRDVQIGRASCRERVSDVV